MIVTNSNGKKITLNQSDYKAAGGEGKIYIKGGYAYKIYHDASHVIPLSKIRELSSISLDNVLVPIDIISSTKSPVGFYMKYVNNTAHLMRTFNKGFKSKNSIDISKLVSIMINTTKKIHTNKILIGDYNELNFLLDDKFSNVYFIDCDSYQTPSFKCTAIMDTVRDRRLKFGNFDEGSDWFGLGIVSFQMFIGQHPYRCNHPKYTPQDIKALKLMDDGVSVFDKDSTLSRQAIPLSTIPKNLLDWYKKIFTSNYRDEPPIPGKVITGAIKVNIIQSTDNFDVTLFHEYDSNIEWAGTINGRVYVITQNSIYFSTNKAVSISSNRDYHIVSVQRTIDPYIAKINGVIQFIGFDGQMHAQHSFQEYIYINGRILAINGDKLIESDLILNSSGTLIATVRYAGNIIPNSHFVGESIIVQDAMGNIKLTMSYARGFCRTINVKELNNHRILNAKYDIGTKLEACIIISEHQGTYYRHVIFIEKDEYSIRTDITISTEPANFIILHNDVFVSLFEDKCMELAVGPKATKVVSNPPVDSSMKLYKFGTSVMVADGKCLLQIKTKK